MKLGKILLAAAAAFGLAATSCQDNAGEIGSSLMKGEVTIVVDSLVIPIESTPVEVNTIDGRALTKLLGRINVPEYGSLKCSFVTQLLSATKLDVPDSIGVEDLDSMRLVLTMPRGALVGDSLAPQQLKVFRLTKQIPSGITSSFDPAGYYNPSEPLGVRSYTLCNIANDSLFNKSPYVKIPVKMPYGFAREVFERYRTNPDVFQWPSTFNEWFPGVYVDQNFGNGVLANITRVEMFEYWHYTSRVYQKTGTDENGKDVYGYVDHIKRDSVCVFASQPEVISSNMIDYRPAKTLVSAVGAGEAIVTSPSGFRANIHFPADKLLEEYARASNGLSVVSSLKFEIPATKVKNDHNIGVAPYLLMVRTSEAESFFTENKVPDNITSFYADFDEENQVYHFNGMRSYFLKLLEDQAAGKEIGAEDMEFTLLPVSVTTETVSGYQTSTVYVTKCSPYTIGPTMTRLHTDRARVCFTFSSQEFEQ